MNPLVLEQRESSKLRIDMRGYTPDRLAGMAQKEIQSLPLFLGNEKIEAGEFFSVSGTDTQQIRILAKTDKLDFVGANMTSGAITLEGSAGIHIGQEMRGGELHVTGNAGIYAGAGLAGGKLLIDGNSGDFLGAALPGEKQGMTGGVIVLKGNSGDRIGDRQRRGTIIVEGNAGDYCGSRLIAGTIAILGKAGKLAGFNMKRGTLLLSQEAESIPVTFNDNGSHQLPFVTLLIRELETWSDAFAQLNHSGTRVRRYLGDRACGGLGELLLI